MKLQQRINLLTELRNYFISNPEEWIQIKEKAERENGWFTQPFIELACNNIAASFLDDATIHQFVNAYAVPAELQHPRNIGVVMAGNIPLVGFHDWLCVFLSGHNAVVKPSSKDKVLITHLVQKLESWNPAITGQTRFAEMLKGCDAYIATGSNNSARYFEYYFSKYPHIIRRNRSSVAILTGKESGEDLDLLAQDVHFYFGLGCRNITKIWVPEGYDFVPLLEAFKRFAAFADHNKYKNNYDYQLAIALLNNQYYMTNGSILLMENKSVFSPISQLNYEFYNGNPSEITASLQNNEDIQCVIGSGLLPFGSAQKPAITDFADGVDSMQFLLKLDSNL